MCGRYTLYDISKAEFPIPKNMVGVNYNVAPSTLVPVVINNLKVQLVRWTLRVSWATNLNVINARSETLETNKIFQNTNRCIFIANGFFEWLRNGKEKKPYYHTFANQLMYFGGVFNDYGACIVTRKSYSLNVVVHQRQPVILRYNEFSNWLSSQHDYTCEHSKHMQVYPVSTKVNSTKNNSVENIFKVA